MSLDLESRLRTFLASAPQTQHPIKTWQFSHSNMSQVWRLWREPYAGVAGGNHMRPCNIDAKLAGSPGHLDQKFDISVDLTDGNDEFREELDRIPVDTQEKIVAVYQEFLSDDLVTPQATATLQVESISYAKGAANLSAVSPRYNITRTGEVYSPKDVPMLRGFI